MFWTYDDGCFGGAALTIPRPYATAQRAAPVPSSAVTVDAALRWVMDNTINASRVGLSEWASNGLHFAETTGNPGSMLLEERLEIAQFYSHALRKQSVAAVVKQQAARCRTGPLALGAPAVPGGAGGGAEEPMAIDSVNGTPTAAASAPSASPGVLAAARTLVDRVEAHAKRHGKNVMVVATDLDEECEREIEQEVEQEEEVEEEVPREEPAAEARRSPCSPCLRRAQSARHPGRVGIRTRESQLISPLCLQVDWAIAAAVGGGIDAVRRAAAAAPGLMSLGDFVGRSLRPPALGTICWTAGSGGSARSAAAASSGVWMTSNFANSVESAGAFAGSSGRAGKALNTYLIPVNALCLLPDGHVLILTDREAEALLESGRWQAGSGGGGTKGTLLHFAYTQDDSLQAAQSLSAQVLPGQNALRLMASGAVTLHPAACAKLQLFAGRTTLGGQARCSAVKALLPTRADKDAALELPKMRGFGHLIQRSQLEDICQMD